MTVAVINTGASNLHSISAALQRLGVRVRIADAVADLNDADRIILPGVGHAAHVMPRLHAADMVNAIRCATVPVLGICLGMQLLFDHTEEGNVDGIGLLRGRCRSIPSDRGVAVPHMGWNTIHDLRGSLFHGVPEGSAVYFVHRYVAVAVDADDVTATVEHVQFHPEKSGAIGARILMNFLRPT
jgi:imidazole glycerol-phosphate synthase subunit HisH